MAKPPKPYGLPADWMAKAQHWQHGLNLENLVSAQARESSKPQSWSEVHPEMEMGVILSGRSHHSYLDYELSLGPGEVWLGERWEPHGVRMEAPTSRVVLVFVPEFLGEAVIGDLPWLHFFSAPPELRPQVKDDLTRARVLSLGQAMRAEVSEKQLGWESALRHYALLLLLALRRTWTPTVLPGRGELLRTGLSRVMPALELMRTSPSRRINLQEAALACGLSVSQFSRVFRATMRTSFSRFEQDARINAAATLLRRTDLPTQVVAERAGFVDAGHLYRVFMEMLKVSPSDFRRTHRQNEDD